MAVKKLYRAEVEHPYAQLLKRHDMDLNEFVYRYAYSPAQAYKILQKEYPGRYIFGITEVPTASSQAAGEQLQMEI